MDEDFNNYPIVLDDVVYMSDDINPFTFRYALMFESAFPLEANFIRSLLGNTEILSYLVEDIHKMFKKYDVEGWVFNFEELKKSEDHPMTIIFLLYYQPQIFQYIAKKIYNMQYDIVKPKLGDFLDLVGNENKEVILN